LLKQFVTVLIMFNTKIYFWPYVVFLVYYLLMSFNLQTNLVFKFASWLKHTLQKNVSNEDKGLWLGQQRKHCHKIAAGRKIFFTLIVGIKLFSLSVSQQWTDSFTGYTTDCFFGIPQDADLTLVKVAIFVGADFLIDAICFYVNKVNRFDNIIYCNSERAIVFDALMYYFYSFIIEFNVKKLLSMI